MPDSWAVDLEHRFTEACRAAEKRHDRRLQARELAERLPALVPEMEAVAAAENHAEVRGQWFALRKQWQAIARELEIDPALTERYDAAARAIETKEQVLRDAKAGDQQKNLQRLQAIVADLEARAAAESLTLKGADGLMKEVKLAIGTMGPLPSKQDRDDLTVRLQAVRTSLAPRIQEMREAEEWKRWANVQVQEDLCAKMEALVAIAEAEPEKAANEMRALQERWKPVAAAPRSQASALWTRFKAAQDQVYEKCKDFFAQQNAERGENLKKKIALAERAEALQDSTDWVRTAEAIKQLQAEWKEIGPVTRGHERASWERFRAACDKFFTRRQEDLKQRKHDWTENLRKKEALVAEAEQLAQSSEWEKAAARIKQIQVEWKGIGPVKRSKSEAIWQRFRAACDLFFERFKNRDQAALQGQGRRPRDGRRRARIAGAGRRMRLTPPMPDDLFARVQAARARWVQGPELPRHTLTPLADRVNEALLKLVTRFPQAFTGHRSGSRGDARPHAEADRQGREAPAGRERRAGEEPVTGGAAGAAVARSAGREHDGRRRRAAGRGRAAAGCRTGGAQRAGGVEPAGAACRRKSASRCRSASIAPCGSSSRCGGARRRGRRARSSEFKVPAVRVEARAPQTARHGSRPRRPVTATGSRLRR